MKKTLLLFVIMLILLITTGCTNQNVDTSKLNVVSSFYPIYIATSNIIDGANNVELTNLTAPSTGCLHDYQITTQDMVKLSTADILIINGDGMESFVDKVAQTYSNINIINASEGIKENHEELIAHEENHDEHEHNHEENSHYWVSISLYIEQVKNIKNELVKIDSQNADIYEKNANIYIEKLENLKAKMHSEVDDLENKNIVTFHEAFSYFAEEFNLNVVGVIEREPGTYPSSREIADIIKEIKSKNVNAIFVEPQYSRVAADAIARETSVKVYNLDPIVTGKLEKDAYIKIMEQNLMVLKEALQ